MPSSSSPPPSYSSRSSTKSSSSSDKKRERSAADKDKDKERDRDNEKNDSRNTTAKEKHTTRENDDAVSIHSKSSSARSMMTVATTSSTQSAMDTLRDIAGSGVRRAKCRAEFLEELARDPDERANLDKDVAERLRIVTGKEAIAFFRKFVGYEPLESGLRTEEEKETMKKIIQEEPVVFAVCVIEAGRRFVDYYMTWRGNARAKDLGSSHRRDDLLDDEFRKVRRSIDRSYRQRTSGDGDDSRSRKASKSKRRPSTPPPRKHSTKPPNIIVSSPDAAHDLPSPITPTSRKRPASANDSVISLPFLGAVRGVPPGNRLPLRVTNPDRNSFAGPSVIGEDPILQIPTNASLETLIEAPESAENVAAPDPGRQSSVDTLVSDADQKLGVPKDKKGYPESVSSAGSRSSRSSRSRTHRSRSRKSSSSKKHHELSRSKSERKEYGHSSSSKHKDHKDKDDDGNSTHRHHRHHHRSSRHHDEKDRKDDDDRSSRKSDRKGSSSSRKPLKTDITLVMVDPDEVDRESIREVMKQPPSNGGRTWHNSVLGHAAQSKPAAIQSPWAGPLARESRGVSNISPYGYPSDEESSSDESDRIPVIPKSFARTDTTNDSESTSSSSIRLRSSPPPMEGHAPAKPEPQAQYPRGPNNPHASPPANAYTPSSQSQPHQPHPHPHPHSKSTPLIRGIPVAPQVSPYTYGSPSVDHKGLATPAHTAYSISSPPFGAMSPGSGPGGYTPATTGYIAPPTVISPAHSTGSLPPGFIPTHISPIGSNASIPLPGIHQTVHNTTAAVGNSSPYLYATPRASPGSPYVPAWISPHSTASGGLPNLGTLSPASVRSNGVSLHPPIAGTYVPVSRSAAPY